ncbi:DUF5134 domain-containing protein [Williamsia maris]|uniref:DUF5134 domain-containing protein n=1 Tax=Williamsia maris TaxID=72806 RepID=A0ABT1HBL7_9NOCA|nr:DUF5134 domain-containing protein [Williamsia maris]MCP2175554.1 hypothetical protein [Williamsia maris]
MITDLTLRWVVTVLFAASVAECGYSLTRHRHSRRSTVGHWLHLIMAVAMIVMAWPFGMDVPNIPPMVFFTVATLWFLASTVSLRAHRGAALTGVYHAAMMGAMAWMYAVMDGTFLPGTTPMTAMSMASASGENTSMTGMDMSSGSHAGHMSTTGWVAGVDTALVIGFGAAALWWLYRYLAARQADSRGQTRLIDHAGTLCQAFMAAGMSIMFSVM